MSDQLARQDVRPLARYAAIVLSSGDAVIVLLVVSVVVPAIGRFPAVGDGNWMPVAIVLVYFLLVQVILIPLIIWLYRF